METRHPQFSHLVSEEMMRLLQIHWGSIILMILAYWPADFLNGYAKLLAPILDKIMELFPHQMLDIGVNTDEFETQDDKEANIYRFMALSESLIRQILQPSLILQQMKDFEL